MTKEYANANPDKLGFPKIIIRNNLEDHKKDITSLDTIRLHLKPNPRHKWNNVPLVHEQIFDELSNELKATGLEKFIKKYDKYTVAAFLAEQIQNWLKEDTQTYPEENDVATLISAVQHFGEISESAIGLNNLALVESVLDNSHFSVPSDQWRTVKGGMQRLPDAFKPILGDKIAMGAEVFKLEYIDNMVHLHYNQNGVPLREVFNNVIVTVPFGSLRFWETPVFGYRKREAIQSLNYDHSTKIFLQFGTRFWENERVPNYGGVTKTDLPARRVVYPSYGLRDKDKGTLLVSYTWANDAIRWQDLKKEDQKKVILKNLSILHPNQVRAIQDVTNQTTKCWLEAFALFGPGQLQHLLIPGSLPEFNIHFAGEHLSVDHAWLIGSLKSTHRAVLEILYSHKLPLEGLVEWEQNSEWVPSDPSKESNWNRWKQLLRVEQ